MARREVPVDECVNKRLVLCSEARKNVLRMKARLMEGGKPHSDEVVINKMLREFPMK